MQRSGSTRIAGAHEGTKTPKAKIVERAILMNEEGKDCVEDMWDVCDDVNGELKFGWDLANDNNVKAGSTGTPLLPSGSLPARF